MLANLGGNPQKWSRDLHSGAGSTRSGGSWGREPHRKANFKIVLGWDRNELPFRILRPRNDRSRDENQVNAEAKSKSEHKSKGENGGEACGKSTSETLHKYNCMAHIECKCQEYYCDASQNEHKDRLHVSLACNVGGAKPQLNTVPWKFISRIMTVSPKI